MKGNPMKKIILSAIALFLLIGGIGLAQPTRRSGSSPIERASPVLWNSDGSVYLPANVGIGTTSASSALSVVGNILATGEVSGATLQAGGTTGVSEIRLDANNTVIQSVDANGIYLGDLNAANTASLRVDGSLYIGASNGLIRFLTSTEGLANAIATTPSGGMIVLSPGATYALNTGISRSTPLYIMGNGATITTTATSYLFTLTAPIYVWDLNVSSTVSNPTGGVFYLNGSTGTVLGRSYFNNVSIDVAVAGSTGSQEYRGWRILDALARIEHPKFHSRNISTTTGEQLVTAINVQNNSTAEVDTSIYIYDPAIYISGTGTGAGGYGIFNYDNSATKQSKIYVDGGSIYVAAGKTTSTGIHLSGGDTQAFINGTRVSGSKNDINAGSGKIILSNTVLEHNTCTNCYNTPAVMIGTSDYLYNYNGSFKGNVGIGTASATVALEVGSGGTVSFADGAGDVYIKDEVEIDGSSYFGNALTDRLTIDSGVYQSNPYFHFKRGTTCYEVTFVPSYSVATGTCSSMGM